MAEADQESTPPEASENGTDSIAPIDIQTEVGQSFLDYAMSVIISRALPDARDGLKPVHRRILWSMSETGLLPNRGHVKCATVVGDVIAKYHPHGDSAVYDALVRMGQSFSLRHPLVDPHGNFGSPGDRAAAYRYTECRMTELAQAMLDGTDEDTVDFASNFDGRHTEPEVLPSRFPNLLVNGSQGIAVGVATNIPPHNLGEIVDACIHLLHNPEATYEDLHEIVKGPDFPTGGQILGKRAIQLAYKAGRSQIKLRGVSEIIEDDKNPQIIFTELPYQVSAEAVEEKVYELVSRKQIDGLKDVRNESAKGVTRFVFDLNGSVNPNVVLNNLYKHTPLQISYAVNMVALLEGMPRTLNLKEMLSAYTEHQKVVLRRRSEYRLAQNQDRVHILEGLIKALDLIDEIIAAIKISQDRGAAREALMAEPYEFSEIQANHILDMALGRLTRLGHAELEEELKERRQTITELETILADEKKLAGVIISELTEIREAHAEPRQTEIIEDPGEFFIEDLIEDEELVFMLTRSGYVKCVSAEEFRAQGRGGQGVTGATLGENDNIQIILNTTAHSYLLFFTNKGKVYRIKAYEVPSMGRTARGRAIVNILQMDEGEKIATVIDAKNEASMHSFLFFATRNGTIKKTELNKYESVRKNGLRAVNLADDDELIQVLPVSDRSDICLVSQMGQVIRFKGSMLRATGRIATGVRGMRFRKEDKLVAAVEIESDTRLLVVTEKGFGKRTEFSGFRVSNRGGLGVKGATIRKDRGLVLGALSVKEDDEVIMMAESGKLLRVLVEKISIQSRVGSGVRMMRVGPQDSVVSLALLDEARKGLEEESDADAAAPDSELAADEDSEAAQDLEKAE